MVSIENSKSALRVAALAGRDAIPEENRIAAVGVLADRAFPIPIHSGMVVSGYMPMGSEFDPLPLMRRLADSGAELALPVVVGRGKPLVMRSWRFGDPLNAGTLGIRQPSSSAPEVLPDVLLVPLAAFDRRGHRIGYGAGYYDMTLNRLRSLKSLVAIGLAFAAQEVSQVPYTTHDARLDLVLTERGMVDLRGR